MSAETPIQKAEAVATSLPVMEAGVPSHFTDNDSKIGVVGIALLGLTVASLVYSIHYYKTRIKHINKIDTLRQDVDEIKRKLKKISV